MEKVSGLTKILTLCAVGSSLLTAGLNSGCGDMMTKSVDKEPTITSPMLVSDINEETGNLVKRYETEKDFELLKQAARGYIKIGEFDKARECAKMVLKENYELGLILYGQLEREIPQSKEEK